MKPLRLLYSFPLRVGRTGIGSNAWHQVAGLTRLGVQVTLCCGSLERPIPNVYRVVETMQFKGARIPYRLLGDDRAFRFHDWQVSRQICRECARYDVLHGWPLGSLRTFRVARDLGIPTLLERPNTHTAFAYSVVAAEHAHLGISVPASHTHASNPERLAREEAEYRMAEKLLCPSEVVARTFLDRGFPPGRIARHQYGFAPEEIPRDGPERADPRFTAIFAGRCEPRKGLHYALRAWHEAGVAQSGRFLICGEYVSGYREVLEPLLDHASIEELGFVSNLCRIMRSADVLVLPSIEEGSALVTYEARGAGCVVLASVAAGAAGKDGVDILLHGVGDTVTLARQLRELSQNRSMLDTYRRQNARSVFQLTWSYAAQVLLEQYQLLTRSHSNGS
jgi:glycosyltransferase involved in cell wall biosynthesis